MEIVFEHELHPDLKPLEFLLGTWEGDGLGSYAENEEYPGVDQFRFTQQITFTQIGKPYLIYNSRTWLLDENFKQGRALATESGFWRCQPDRQVEVMLAHPTGIVEIYLGEVAFNRVELTTDAVVRTATAKEVSGGKRMYGLFPDQGDGAPRDLGWVYEMQAMGQPLQAHLSAQLKKAV
jgi:hypothetical protein